MVCALLALLNGTVEPADLPPPPPPPAKPRAATPANSPPKPPKDAVDAAAVLMTVPPPALVEGGTGSSSCANCKPPTWLGGPSLAVVRALSGLAVSAPAPDAACASGAPSAACAFWSSLASACNESASSTVRRLPFFSSSAGFAARSARPVAGTGTGADFMVNGGGCDPEGDAAAAISISAGLCVSGSFF